MFERTIFQNRSSKSMLKKIHALMDEADVIVSYNGLRFDIPTLNREFLLNDMLPPAPSKQIDLYPIAKRRFKFTSHKMDYIAQQLGVGKKHETNFELWVKCMSNDPDAFKEMEKYNRNDVTILQAIYKELLPWLPNQGHAVRNDGLLVCPNCSSLKYHLRGYYYLTGGKYQRYQCLACGHYYRATTNELPPKSVKTVSL